MPKRAPATAPPSVPEAPETPVEAPPVAGETTEAAPAAQTPQERRAARKTAQERRAETTAGNKADEAGPPKPDGKVEGDWTKPDYADNPGDVEFDSMDDEDEFYSLMWYGPEGTGKTTDLAMVLANNPGELLLLNAESGAKRRALQYHGVDTSRIRLYPPRGVDLTFEGLERLYYRLAADLEQTPGKWLAVGWDSATAIYQKLLDNVVEEEIRKQQEILQRAGKGREGRSGNVKLRDRFETDRDDYAAMSNQFRLLLRKYRTLPCHFLVTALERRDEDKGKKVTYGPAVSPALQTDLLGYVDVVIRTQVEDTKNGPVWFGRTAATRDARGKDRIGGLPYELVDPTFERVVAYLTDQLVEAKDPAQKTLTGETVTVVRRSLRGGTGTYGPTDEDRVAESVEPVEEATEPDPPKRASRARKPAASKTPDKPAPEPEPAAEPAEEIKPPARKTAAQRRAERAAKEEVNGSGPTPASDAAKERVAAAKSEAGDSDKPPF
jgi:hypothetical protein